MVTATGENKFTRLCGRKSGLFRKKKKDHCKRPNNIDSHPGYEEEVSRLGKSPSLKEGLLKSEDTDSWESDD